MNKNRENYKKALDQIHVSDSLKEKVLEETKDKSRKPVYYFRYAVSFAVVLAVAIVSVSYLNKPKEDVLKNSKVVEITKENKEELLAKVDIKRFKNSEELREVLKKNNNSNVYNSSIQQNLDEKSVDNLSETEEISDISTKEHSETNNQVENVDEADIVKTDGEFIYYSTNNNVYILDEDLNQVSKINNEEEFSVRNIFVNDTNLVALGSEYESVVFNTTTDDTVKTESVSTRYTPKTVVRVYDMENKEDVELKREILVDGYYKDARMIDDNVYFTSTYSIPYYSNIDELKDTEILPSYNDSNVSKDDTTIEANRIICFASDIDKIEDCSYSIITGFNLNSDDDANIETFLGSGNDMYVSEDNMYISSPNYGNNYQIENSTIYKFQLKDSDIFAVGKCNVDGYILNQFSMDEYNGNFRIASTISNIGEDFKSNYQNKITIFDENLNQIGQIENLIENEKIYSVRFMGNVGYVVTFEQIDPLWVIDLSDPTNPVVKGELEIPGYSSYLHPYDENHIIGIGYNVVDNGYGGLKNDTIKLSMFDVSDLENPKELFNISFDNKYTYTNVMDNHKALFFNKEKNLIGFPVNWYKNGYNSTGLILYKIDLENNKFEEISNLTDKGYGFVQRAIYIGDYIYNLFDKKVIKYDMNTFEEVKKIELEK